jgi:hypothetical protein
LLIYVAAIDGSTELLRKPVGEPDTTESDGETLSRRPSFIVGPSLDNLGISDGSCEMLGKLDGTRDSGTETDEGLSLPPITPPLEELGSCPLNSDGV